MRTRQPQQEVDVVTAFGQQDRIGFALAPEDAAHVAVGGPVESDRSGMVDRNDVSQPPRSDQLADLGEIGMVAQHMADADQHAAPAGAPGDFAAFVETLGDRLFEQDVVSGVDSLHGRVEMGVFGGRDQHHVGIEPLGEEVVVMGVAILVGKSEGVGHGAAAQVVDFDDRGQPELFGIPAGVFEVFMRPVAGADHDDPHGPGEGCFSFHRMLRKLQRLPRLRRPPHRGVRCGRKDGC